MDTDSAYGADILRSDRDEQLRLFQIDYFEVRGRTNLIGRLILHDDRHIEFPFKFKAEYFSIGIIDNI